MFTPSSLLKLATCDKRLQDLFVRVAEYWHCEIAVGHRGEAAQTVAVTAGLSKTVWPTSKHNAVPSLAVDVYPAPLDWDDVQRFVYFAGFVKGVAALMGIPIRWGGDWANADALNPKGVLNDLDHFELDIPYDPESQTV